MGSTRPTCSTTSWAPLQLLRLSPSVAGADPSGWGLPAAALETCLRQVTVAHLRKAATAHALQLTTEASAAADLAKRAVAFADVLEADPERLVRIIASEVVSAGEPRLQPDPAALAVALNVPVETLTSGLLPVCYPFAVRRGGVAPLRRSSNAGGSTVFTAGEHSVLVEVIAEGGQES